MNRPTRERDISLNGLQLSFLNSNQLRFAAIQDLLIIHRFGVDREAGSMGSRGEWMSLPSESVGIPTSTNNLDLTIWLTFSNTIGFLSVYSADFASISPSAGADSPH
jgi:hypothetical protein